MPFTVQELRARRIVFCPPDGPPLRTGRDATDLIGETRSLNASDLVVPMRRLDPEFFQLRTGIAGEFVQKFVNYGVRLIVLGDTNELASQSKALHDFIYESNQGRSIWFLPDRQALEDRLTSERTNA
jgi:hypothetical protein